MGANAGEPYPSFSSSVSVNIGVHHENWVRGSGKDSLAVREASAGRVASVPFNCFLLDDIRKFFAKVDQKQAEIAP
jgi:hypothetical protein